MGAIVTFGVLLSAGSASLMLKQLRVKAFELRGSSARFPIDSVGKISGTPTFASLRRLSDCDVHSKEAEVVAQRCHCISSLVTRKTLCTVQ